MATMIPVQRQDFSLGNQTEAKIPGGMSAQHIAAVKVAFPAVHTLRWLILGQIMLGCTIVGLSWLLFGALIAKSVLCGVLAAVLPTVLFLRSLKSRFFGFSAQSVVLNFFAWEFIKIVATVSIIFMAQRWVLDLNWLAMLVGLAITLKVYWLVLVFQSERRCFCGDVLPSGKSNLSKND